MRKNVMVGAFLAMAACSPSSSEANPPVSGPSSSSSSSQQSLGVEPGAPAPSAAERAHAIENLKADLSRSPSNLLLHQRADGLQELEVVRGFRHATMVVRGPDGLRRVHCLNDVEEAVRLLQREPE